MIRVGLTGGIGSGKTTVAKVFEVLGVPVYYADLEAKRLMTNDVALREAIQREFGADAYNSDGLNRKFLARAVFKDEKALEQLNNLVHPVVRKDFKEWSNVQVSSYVIEESAILFETGLYLDFDCVVSVLCPMEERLIHLQKRDHSTIEQIQARMSVQVNDKTRQEKSDYVLQNGQDNLLLPQIVALDRVFRSKI